LGDHLHSLSLRVGTYSRLIWPLGPHIDCLRPSCIDLLDACCKVFNYSYKLNCHNLSLLSRARLTASS
jgi:hypothetical protein